MKLKFSNIIFDFDGTLVDSLRDVLDSLKLAFKQCGIRAKNYDTGKIIQLQLREAICAVAPGITAEQTGKVIRRFREIYDSTDYPNTRLMPAVAELLPELKRQRIGMYIVSNKRRIPTIRILDKFNLRHFFIGIFNPDMYEGEKRMTKSELLAHAIEKHSIPKDSAAYIGDSEVDVIAAKENGVLSIVVANGYGKAEKINIKPHHTVPTVSEIILIGKAG